MLRFARAARGQAASVRRAFTMRHHVGRDVFTEMTQRASVRYRPKRRLHSRDKRALPAQVAQNIEQAASSVSFGFADYMRYWV